jgi:membrane protein
MSRLAYLKPDRPLLRQVWAESTSDEIGLIAAGCAFWAIVALFPAISVLVTLYGMVFDPAQIAAQLAVLEGLLPPAAADLIAERIRVFVEAPRERQTLRLILSLGAAFWAASGGVRSMIKALDLAYEEPEKRPRVIFYGTAFAMTLGGLAAGILALTVLIGLPAVLANLGEGGIYFYRVLSLLLLLGLVIAALCVLYRYGPSHGNTRRRVVLPGAILAAVLWAAASAGFSFYVSHFASYDRMYGPPGALVALMMWFWVTMYVILFGAELNSAYEERLEAGG